VVRAARHDWRPLAPVSVALGAWGLAYALYRGYYAVGGTLLLPGRPADPAQFRLINAVAAVILVIAAALPIAVLPLWRIPRARWVLLAVCWAVAVGCCTHALINSIQRVLSLAGLLRIEYPPMVWAWIDRRAADLQDLFFNEPWFLAEGLGFGDRPGPRSPSAMVGRHRDHRDLVADRDRDALGDRRHREDDHWVTGRVLAVHRGMTGDYGLFEGTSEIQRLVISRANRGMT
jgi:hypothetical protein